MASGVQNAFSTTAASNGTADSGIVASEGQAPGTVNDGVRGLMAVIKKWCKDWQGGLLTAGGSTAYTLTTNETLVLADGVSVVCRMHATNGATPTLNVDATGAVAIQSVQGTAIQTGRLLVGAVYKFTYYASAAAWIANGMDDPVKAPTFAAGAVAAVTAAFMPAGTIMLFVQTAAPTGWTKDTTHDDKALRIVSGAASSGGTKAFSSAFTSRTPAGTNGTSTVTGTVAIPADGWGVIAQAAGRLTVSASAGTQDRALSLASGLAAAQTFTGAAMDFAVKYVDAIIAAKD